MNKTAIIALAAALAATGANAKSPKRGVAENQFQMAYQMEPLAPGVTWYYNWASAPGNGYQGEVKAFADFEYVPMCWNGVNADAIRQACKDRPEIKYILGFNEPNFTDQANMTPAQAAEKWPALVALARELGLEIVAPAMNYSSGTYAQPSKWMNEFVNLVGLDAFDYTAIHCYGGLGVLQTLATEFHNLYGKPVWVTEFCMWPGGAGNVYVSPQAQLASLVSSVEWLEKTDFIYRYSWFKPIGDHDSSGRPNYGLIVSAPGYSEKELSPQGWAYTYLTDFNPNVWNAVGQTVAATEYIASNGLLVGKGENSACPRPIEISQFNTGAKADYQFDVDLAGEYILQLTVSGYGEPTRFDPSLAVKLLDNSGNEVKTLTTTGKFSLPNSDTAYTTVDLQVTLAAGRQTLRIEDVNPMQPSGLRISTIALYDKAGISDVTVDNPQAAPIRYYDTHGRLVEASRLAPGLYITSRGEKVMVK